jgi:bacterioferritin-associated ferredoxin
VISWQNRMKQTTMAKQCRYCRETFEAHVWTGIHPIKQTALQLVESTCGECVRRRARRISARRREAKP